MTIAVSCWPLSLLGGASRSRCAVAVQTFMDEGAAGEQGEEKALLIHADLEKDSVISPSTSKSNLNDDIFLEIQIVANRS